MLLLVYSATLLVVVLVSERAHRIVLSTAVLFLLVGAAVGQFQGTVSTDVVRGLAELALVTVLFKHLVAITIALSLLLHSSRDVPIARWFERTPRHAGTGVDR